MVSFIQRYWRGELPLGLCVWLVAGALTAALLVIDGMDTLGRPSRTVLMTNEFFVYFVSGIALLIIVPIWQCVGAMRAAYVHLEQVGTIIAARSSQVAIVMLMLFAITRVVTFAGECLALAPPALNMGAYKSEITREFGARQVTLSGGFGFGLAERIADELDDATQAAVRRIHLESSGGSLHEAKRIGSLIREHRLNATVIDRCTGNCALALAAGEYRTAHRGAVIEWSQIPGDDPDIERLLHGRGLAGWFLAAWRSGTLRAGPLPAEAALASGLINRLYGSRGVSPPDE